jgi:hypothetical protein
MTDDLIDRLSTDLRPTPAGAVIGRLLTGLAAGGAISVALVVMLLGVRPDVRAASVQPMFWMKFAYGLAIAAVALWGAERLARPAATARGRLAWLAAPVLVLGAVALWRLTHAPEAARMGLLMGHSARLCSWLILAFSLPPMLGLVWAMRSLAPTRLRLAGLALGLAAGGAGAGAYALHCDEMAAPFLAAWYTLGVAAAGAVGWALAPRLLRW